MNMCMTPVFHKFDFKKIKGLKFHMIVARFEKFRSYLGNSEINMRNGRLNQMALGFQAYSTGIAFANKASFPHSPFPIPHDTCISSEGEVSETSAAIRAHRLVQTDCQSVAD